MGISHAITARASLSNKVSAATPTPAAPLTSDICVGVLMLRDSRFPNPNQNLPDGLFVFDWDVVEGDVKEMQNPR